MDNNINVLKDSSKGRAAFYEYLSEVFKMPSTTDFIGVTKIILPYLEAFAGETGNETIKEGCTILASYAELEADSDPDVILDFLNMKYTSMFLLGGNSVPSSESAMLNPSGMIRQEEWEAVMAFYHIRKFKKPDEIKEPEDHVSVELLFMRKMCELSAYLIDNEMFDNLRDAFEEQSRFLNEHLLMWLPQFCDMVIAQPVDEGDVALYNGAAAVLKGFLQEEKRLMDYLLTES